MLEQGTLIVKISKSKTTTMLKTQKAHYSLPEAEISESLWIAIAKNHAKEVEFELVKGQPKKVREVGGEFRAHSGSSQPRGAQRPSQARVPQAAPLPVLPRGDFHNPYNFIPAPPRDPADPELGDQKPISQQRFDPERYTGQLRVELTVHTPLLVPDSEKVCTDTNGHKTFALRVGSDGKPALLASSVRGMLRSAYEAITNSRLGCFSQAQHQKPLAFRMEPRDALTLIPARVQNGRIWLLPGTSEIGRDGKPIPNVIYAAWLPRYCARVGGLSANAVKYRDGTLPQHGEEVECVVERVPHYNRNTGKNDFEFWEVRAIARLREELIDPQDQGCGSDHYHSLGERKKIRGWVSVTHQNIKNKHHERVFFKDAEKIVPADKADFSLSETHRASWRNLIENYQVLHEKELAKRKAQDAQPEDYLGGEPGKTAWSRHVYSKEMCDLVDGTLCYVRLTDNHKDVAVLFPVMIARELYTATPWELLHPSLLPAASIEELSPADRVFGWVNADAKNSATERPENAVRGLLQLGPVRCESSVDDASEIFPWPGRHLAILASPKPQQGRFYVATTVRGEAQEPGLSKSQAGYRVGKGLRGRKVYPHHAKLVGNVQHAWTHPAQACDEQNQSVLGWVKPGARFRFDLRIQNLSAVELGALLWLLQLPKQYFFRLGGGKPLGFGSVQVEVLPTETDIRTGRDALQQRYTGWDVEGTPSNFTDCSERCILAFKMALQRGYGAGSSFERISFIEAFLAACEGDTVLPVHYPRQRAFADPRPADKGFEWFVNNDAREHRYALPALVGHRGLPYL